MISAVKQTFKNTPGCAAALYNKHTRPLVNGPGRNAFVSVFVHSSCQS